MRRAAGAGIAGSRNADLDRPDGPGGRPGGLLSGRGTNSRVQLFNADGLREAVGFSHVAVGGDTVWVSGQLGTDAEGEIEGSGELAAQARAAFRNLARALESAGCRPEDVLRMTYYVTDVAAYRAAGPQVGRAFEHIFGARRPAATVVGVSELIHPDALLQIDCVALPHRQRRRSGP